MPFSLTSRSRVDLTDGLSAQSIAHNRSQRSVADSERSSRSSSFLQRVSALFSHGDDGKRASQPRARGSGIEHVVAPSADLPRYRYDRSASQSPEMSLDIRPPSRLGEFGSAPSSPVKPTHETIVEEPAEEPTRRERQRRSSAPAPRAEGLAVAGRTESGYQPASTEERVSALFLDAEDSSLGSPIGSGSPLPTVTATAATATTISTSGPPTSPHLPDLPTTVLEHILSFLSRQDLVHTSCISRSLCKTSQRSLYHTLNFLDDPTRAERCLKILRVSPSLANLVYNLSAPLVSDLPSGLRALTSLQSLTVPTFDAHALRYTTFHLQSLNTLDTTFTGSDDGDDRLADLFLWLAARPGLTALHLGSLTLPLTLSPSLLPPNLLPHLTTLSGPPGLAAILVPGRPVSSIRLNLHRGATIHAGFRPSALTATLSTSSAAVTKFGMIADSSIDGRTLERMLMAIGNDLGSRIRHLRIECSLEEENLYRHFSAALPRFTDIRMLIFSRPPKPPPPIIAMPIPIPPHAQSSRKLSPVPLTPLSISGSPGSPSFSTMYEKHLGPHNLDRPPLSPAAESFVSARSRPGSPATPPPTSPLPRIPSPAPEPAPGLTPLHVAHLRTWTKSCRTLDRIVFPGGAEWRIVRIRAPPNSRAPSAVWGRARASRSKATLASTRRGDGGLSSPPSSPAAGSPPPGTVMPRTPPSDGARRSSEKKGSPLARSSIEASPASKRRLSLKGSPWLGRRSADVPRPHAATLVAHASLSRRTTQATEDGRVAGPSTGLHWRQDMLHANGFSMPRTPVVRLETGSDSDEPQPPPPPAPPRTPSRKSNPIGMPRSPVVRPEPDDEDVVDADDESDSNGNGEARNGARRSGKLHSLGISGQGLFGFGRRK